MTDEAEVHDLSRLDAFMKARRRSMMMHAMWKPALAGAAGAGLIIAAVAVAQPKFITREVTVDHVTMRKVTADHVIQRDVPINNLVPHEVLIDIPRIVSVTPTEKRFLESPAFVDAPAEYRGRIISSRSPGVLSFAEGGDYVPTQPGMVADAAPYIGDFGACSPIPGTEHFHCVALHNGVVTPVPQKPVGRPT